MMLNGRRILLGVSGCVAAFKAAYLARRLYYDSPRDLDDAITVRMDFAGGLWGE